MAIALSGRFRRAWLMLPFNSATTALGFNRQLTSLQKKRNSANLNGHKPIRDDATSKNHSSFVH
jgi:hypothetical protein